MKSTSAAIKLILGLLLLGLGGWFLYVNIEIYEETEATRWSRDAIRNPYLAAQQFMTRSGVDVTDVDSLARLDELIRVGTLFFSDPNQVQNPRQLEQVLDWLEAGGNVIYTANSVAHEDDLLLAEIGVEVRWREFDDPPREEKPLSETFREYNRQIEQGKSREEIARGLEREEALTVVGFGEDIGDLEIAFAPEKVLDHPYLSESDDDSRYPPFSWSSSEYGIHMMQFEVGSGLLTIISDPGIWTSFRIDQHDHAYLLWLLSSADGVFALLRSVVRESIWGLILHHASELLIAAAILVGLWIWHLAYRFGRLQARDRSRQRALGEHFSSLSHYLWHRRRGQYLVEPLRQQVLRRASLVLGDFSRADHPRQMQLLAERAGIEVAAISNAFESREFSEATFVNTVRLLKRIEQSL